MQPRLRLGQETTCLPLPFPRHLVWSGLPKGRQLLRQTVGLKATCGCSVLRVKQVRRRDPGNIFQGRGFSSVTWGKWRGSLSIRTLCFLICKGRRSFKRVKDTTQTGGRAGDYTVNLGKKVATLKPEGGSGLELTLRPWRDLG